MKLRSNKPVRDLGIYKLCDTTLILLKRSEELSFLFTPDGWYRHGPVDYRLSHGHIFCHGELTGLTDEDLLDTGKTAQAPSLSVLLDPKYIS